MTFSILLYLAVAVFIVGNLVRIVRIVRMPVHVRWELYPVPHEPASKFSHGGSYMEDSEWWSKPLASNKLGELAIMLPEIFLLKGVWERNRSLWLWSWLMHWGLYLMAGTIILLLIGSVGRLTGMISADMKINGFGSALSWVIRLVSWLAVIAGTLGSAGVLLLRLFSRKLRPFASVATIFNVTLILALFDSGMIALLQNPDAIRQIFDLTVSLVTFHRVSLPGGVLATHVIILAFFLIYFPFTHMTHMYMKYFTYHSVRWDDQPLEKGGYKERNVENSLHYPVSWSAPHIRGDGRKKWVDVVSEEGRKSD